MSGPRRWRGAEPPWPQAAANINQPGFIGLTGQHKWLRYAQKRGKRWEPVWPQPTVATPVLVFRSGTRRRPDPYQRRGKRWEAPWGQAAANTNQPQFIGASGQRKWVRVGRPARGRVALALGDQAGNAVQGSDQRRQARAYVRRGRYVFVPADQAPINPVSQRRARYANMRRGDRWEPPWTQVQAPINPAVTFKSGTRRRADPYQRRGQAWEPVWPQQTLPTNPDLVFRSGTRRRPDPYQRRGKRFEPVWPQAAPNTNQPQFVTLSAARRRYLWRPPARVKQFTTTQPDLPTSTEAHRTPKPVLRRSRSQQPVQAQAMVPTVTHRRLPPVVAPVNRAVTPEPRRAPASAPLQVARHRIASLPRRLWRAIRTVFTTGNAPLASVPYVKPPTRVTAITSGVTMAAAVSSGKTKASSSNNGETSVVVV